MERLKSDFSTVGIVLMGVGIVINIVMGRIVTTLSLPLYLDSIGTIFVGAVAGPWVGALAGIISNLIAAFFGNPANFLPYIPVAAIIGFMAGLFSRYGWFKLWWKFILAGVITGVVAALISAPITAYVNSGVVGTGMDALTAAFRSMGMSTLQANFLQGLSTDPLDKSISYLLVYSIIQALPNRYLDRFPRAEYVR